MSTTYLSDEAKVWSWRAYELMRKYRDTYNSNTMYMNMIPQFSDKDLYQGRDIHEQMPGWEYAHLARLLGDENDPLVEPLIDPSWEEAGLKIAWALASASIECLKCGRPPNSPALDHIAMMFFGDEEDDETGVKDWDKVKIIVAECNEQDAELFKQQLEIAINKVWPDLDNIKEEEGEDDEDKPKSKRKRFRGNTVTQGAGAGGVRTDPTAAAAAAPTEAAEPVEEQGHRMLDPALLNLPGGFHYLNEGVRAAGTSRGVAAQGSEVAYAAHRTGYRAPSGVYGRGFGAPPVAKPQPTEEEHEEDGNLFNERQE